MDKSLFAINISSLPWDIYKHGIDSRFEAFGVVDAILIE